MSSFLSIRIVFQGYKRAICDRCKYMYLEVRRKTTLLVVSSKLKCSSGTKVDHTESILFKYLQNEITSRFVGTKEFQS